MSGKTAIEWTDMTWTPVVGCSRVTDGCTHCYAFQLHDMRYDAYLRYHGIYPRSGKPMPKQHAKPFSEVQFLAERLEDPLHIRTPQRMFVNSVSDLLWNIRRHNARVSVNGSAAVLVDEILRWQGQQKHSRVAHPGTGTTKRYTDGYRTEHKQRVIQDLSLLAACNVRGACTIMVRGKTTAIEIDGPYLWYSVVSRKIGPEEKSIIGFLLSPGDWIHTYEQHQNYYLAEVDSRISTLNPQNDRYALRVALYLIERWREQARQATSVRLSRWLTCWLRA